MYTQKRAKLGQYSEPLSYIFFTIKCIYMHELGTTSLPGDVQSLEVHGTLQIGRKEIKKEKKERNNRAENLVT